MLNPPDYGHQKKNVSNTPTMIIENNECHSDNFNPFENWMVKNCLMEAIWVDCPGISNTLS